MFEESEREKIADRFWKKVNKSGPNGCWEWTGAKSGAGYGMFMVNPKLPRLAHRVSFALANGPARLARGMYVCHACDNRLCVNPEHLSLGTAAQNYEDQRKRDRYAYGKRLPHTKLTPEAAREIREKAGTLEGVCEMMLKYRVSETTVRMIYARKSWAHVT